MAAAPSLTPFEILRQQRHAAWLTDLTTRLEQLVASSDSADQGPLEILLFGSRARGDARADSDWDFAFLARAGEGGEVSDALRDVWGTYTPIDSL
jgi:predicted nucleotidyltransferase